MDIYTCPHCNSQFKAEGQGRFRCPACDKEIRVRKKADVPLDTASGDWVRSFYETVKTSLSEPVAFFASVAEGRGMLRPLLYAIVIGIVVFASAAAYQAGFATLQMGTEIADSIKRSMFPTTALTGPLVVIFFLFFAVVGMPLATAFALFLEAAVLHLGLIILGSAKRDFQATFRTVCYSVGPQVFQVVPFLGGIVAGVWVLVLNIIGIKVVHETTYARSTVAVFLPLVLCCGFVLLIATTIAGGVFAALITRQT